MHEMAIAQSVLDIAFSEMDRHAGRKLNKVRVSIGEFSGVVKEALEFAFEILKTDTAAEQAAFEIEVVPLGAECSNCGPVICRVNDLNLLCPNCTGTVRITEGREMKVDYIDIE